MARARHPAWYGESGCANDMSTAGPRTDGAGGGGGSGGGSGPSKLAGRGARVVAGARQRHANTTQP